MLVALSAVTGCFGPPRHTRPTELTALHAGQPGDTYAMSIDDFATLAPRAIKQCHWAVVSKKDEITGYRINAITAAGSPIDIRARQIDAEQVRITIRAGRYGNAEAEQAFLKAFAEQASQVLGGSS